MASERGYLQPGDKAPEFKVSFLYLCKHLEMNT